MCVDLQRRIKAELLRVGHKVQGDAMQSRNGGTGSGVRPFDLPANAAQTSPPGLFSKSVKALAFNEIVTRWKRMHYRGTEQICELVELTSFSGEHSCGGSTIAVPTVKRDCAIRPPCRRDCQNVAHRRLKPPAKISPRGRNAGHLIWENHEHS